MKMRKQRLMGLAMLAITALILVMARGGRTPEDSDATAAFLTGPLGLYRVISVWRRTARTVGTIRPATGTTTRPAIGT